MAGPVVTNKRIARGAVNQLAMWTVGVSASPDRFKTLWFDDNLNTKIAKDSSAERPHRGEVDGTPPGDLEKRHGEFPSRPVQRQRGPNRR